MIVEDVMGDPPEMKRKNEEKPGMKKLLKVFKTGLQGVWGVAVARKDAAPESPAAPAAPSAGSAAKAPEQKPAPYRVTYERGLAEEFRNAAAYVNADLVPLTLQDVRKIKKAFAGDMTAKVDAALAQAGVDGDGKDIHRALTRYAMALSETRKDVTVNALAEAIATATGKILSLDKHILARAEHMRSEISRVEHGIRRKQKDRDSTPAEIKIFGSQDRLYFRLHDRSLSCVRPVVEHFLTAKGFEITDYKGGYATNDGGKNKRRIGKIIASYEDAPAGLQEAFANDPTRYPDDFMVVISRNPVDIARGSHQRGWQSCRSDGDGVIWRGVEEFNAGVIAAYLVRKDDPYIHDPLARIFLKPYDSESGRSTVYLAFNPIGLHFPAFAEAVNRFADKSFNARKFGRFELREGCESYREFKTRSILPRDPVSALRTLGVSYAVVEGMILVEGDLDLSSRGLHRLPDLTKVIVDGGVDISGNKLLTLAGMPEECVDWVKASRTLVSCFAGCTPQVRKEFYYADSPYLLSGVGMPHAGNYNYSDRYMNRHGNPAPVCPIEAPDQFPRFKRK